MILGGPAAVSDAVGNATLCRNPPPDSGGPRFRAIYVVPSDVSVHAELAQAASYELELVSDWFKSQTQNLVPHFARNPDGSIAVATVQLGRTKAEVSQRGFSGMIADLQAAGQLPAGTFAVAYIDAVGPACGQTREITALWMASCGNYPFLDTPGFPYGASYLAAHEMTHALGAVGNCAPHSDHTGHVNDNNRDLLYQGGSPRNWEHLVLDPGNDDYFRHTRSGCVDIEDSPLFQRL